MADGLFRAARVVGSAADAYRSHDCGVKAEQGRRTVSVRRALVAAVTLGRAGAWDAAIGIAGARRSLERAVTQRRGGRAGRRSRRRHAAESDRRRVKFNLVRPTRLANAHAAVEGAVAF